MKLRALIIGIAGIVGLSALSLPSFAQTVDYGSLETLMQQPVTTNATGTPQVASDVATDMTIITADQIRQSGSRSIPQILSRVPGLDILQESSTGFDVGVRGYQQAMEPSLLVLIDGRQVFSDDYSRTIWENLPVNVDDIRQIEVVKGASSALFGSNAAHGVINIITYNPLYDKNDVAAVSLGTQDSLTGDATATTKLGDYGGAKISAGGLTGSEFSTSRPSAESLVTDNPDRRYITESNVFQIAPKLQAFSEVTYSKSDGTEAYYNGQLAGVTDTTYSLRGGASWETPYGTIKSNTYLNHAEVDNHEVSSSLPLYSDTTTAITSQLEDQFRVAADHTIRLSLDFNHKDFALNAPQVLPTPLSPPANSKIEENNFAVGGMWLWQINDQFELTNAVRLDHMMTDESGSLVAGETFSSADFSHAINAISANSGLVYKVTPVDTVRLTFGRGIQMPSLLDYGFNNLSNSNGSPTSAVERLGNPDLNPTVVTDYELAYERKLPEIDCSVKTAIYYEFNRDIISPFPTIVNPIVVGNYTSTRVREATNVGDSEGLGGELELLGSNPSGFRWDASYSYAAVNDTSGVSSPPGVGTAINNQFGYDNSTPYHHFRALFGYTTGKWEFDTNSQLLTDRLLLRGNASRVYSDGYFTIAGRIGYKITDTITAALSGVSLNQSQTMQSAYPAIERQAFLTLTAKF